MKLIVKKEETGQKIVKYLMRKTDGTKVFILKLIRKGLIRVNNKRINNNYIINENDIIECEHLNIFNNNSKKINFKLNEDLIIFEDYNIIVIDKPASIPVYSNNTNQIDLISIIKNYYQEKNINLNYLQPIHRLDKQTKGIIIFSKNHLTTKKYTEYFKYGKITKIYNAEVNGNINNYFKLNNILSDKIMLEADIYRIKDKSNIKNLKIIEIIPEKNKWFNEKNKSNTISATIIKPILIKDKSSIIEVELWTGRHHQIRAICESIGFPIIGDIIYNKNDKSNNLKLISKKIIIEPENLTFESKQNIF